MIRSLFLCGALLTVGLGSTAASAQAGEETEAGDTSEVDRDVGPLRERIRPVSGHMFRKKGRFELSPSLTVSLRDAFFTKFIVGAAATYHPTDWLGFGLRAGYSFPVVAQSAQICTPNIGGVTRRCSFPSFEELNGDAPGQIRLIGGLDVQLSPIYGKIAVLAEQFLHFDMYAIVGAAGVQYVGPGTAEVATRLGFGGNLGGGLRVFINRWLTTRVELRDTIYPEVVLPNLEQPQLRHQILFEFGVSMFFPPTFGEG